MPPLGQINQIVTFLRAGEPDGGYLQEPRRRASAQHEQGASRSGCRPRRSRSCPRSSRAEPWPRPRRSGRRLPHRSRSASYFWHPALYLLAVMVIGSRQHALLILGHDASHYRYLPTRWQNDLFANLLLMWPTFASVEGFRKFHGTHHQFTNLPGDGNRHIWYTHDAMGELEPGWVFPKTRLGLALVLLRRAFFFTGMFWIVRGLVGSFSSRRRTGCLPPSSLSTCRCRRGLDRVRRLGRVPAVLARAVLHLAHRSFSMSA